MNRVHDLVRGLGGALMVIAAVTSAACRETTKVASTPPTVKVTPVIERDVPVYREWLGTTVGFVTAQIRARVSGYLLTQDYKEGSVVKAGDLMFTIDPRPYQASLDQSKGKLEQGQAQLAQAKAQLAQNTAEVEQAKAQVRQAEGEVDKAVAMQVKTQLEVERYTPLAARGSLSQQELDNTVQNNLGNQATVVAERANLDKARAAVERAQAGVEKARADIATAQAAIVQARAGLDDSQLNLGWTKVLAPITGVAGIKKVDIGDLVGTNSVLTTVASIDPIYVQFNLTEQQYLRWRSAGGTGPPPQVQIELILADGHPYPKKGTAEILGLAVDATTGTIPVRASFPNPGNVLRPGQFAKIRVPVVVSKGALLVPQRAVRDTQGLLQVGVVAPDDTVSLKTVQMGERVGTLWIAERGLEPGQRVVVDGLDKVKAGDKVIAVAVEADPVDAPVGGPLPFGALPTPPRAEKGSTQ
jgi:membrane fusion protein (multidrug efflux system)